MTILIISSVIAAVLTGGGAATKWTSVKAKGQARAASCPIGTNLIVTRLTNSSLSHNEAGFLIKGMESYTFRPVEKKCRVRIDDYAINMRGIRFHGGGYARLSGDNDQAVEIVATLSGIDGSPVNLAKVFSLTGPCQSPPDAVDSTAFGYSPGSCASLHRAHNRHYLRVMRMRRGQSVRTANMPLPSGRDYSGLTAGLFMHDELGGIALIGRPDRAGAATVDLFAVVG